MITSDSGGISSTEFNAVNVHLIETRDGGKDLLVVQPEFDLIATIENGRQIVEELPNNLKLVAVPDSGHALLPEQHEIVQKVILEWLRERN